MACHNRLLVYKSIKYISNIHKNYNELNYKTINHNLIYYNYNNRISCFNDTSKINKEKADKLYAAIDGSDFYANPVEKRYRSWMNVPFTLKSADLDAAFLEQAAEKGLATLKGHRSVGGMRASIYNAMPEEGVDTLVEFMKEFAQANA